VGRWGEKGDRGAEGAEEAEEAGEEEYIFSDSLVISIYRVLLMSLPLYVGVDKIRDSASGAANRSASLVQ